MGSSDIIKNIVLKLKGDDSDLKKLESSLTRLNKVASGGSAGGKQDGLSKTIKELANLNKELDKLGKSQSQSFDKITKAAKEMTKTHLAEAEKKFDDLSKKAEKSLEKLQKMKESGASSENIARAERISQERIERALGAGKDVSTTRQTLGGFGGGAGGSGGGGILGAFGGMGKMLGGVGQAILMAGQIPNFLAERKMQQYSDSATAASVTKRKVLSRYEGDLTDVLMQEKYGSQTRAGIQARQTAGAGKTSDLTKLIGGSALGIAGLIAAGTATVASGGLALPALLAAGAAAGGGAVAFSGAKGLDARIFGAKTEAEKAVAYQQVMETEKARQIDPELYNSFRSSARDRLKYQVMFGKTEKETADARIEALGNFVSPEEYQNMAMNMRSRLGSAASSTLAMGAAKSAKELGMDYSVSGQMMSTIAMNSAGGAGKAEETLKEVFAKAVSAGIKDSGLREGMMKAVIAASEASGSRVDTSKIMSEMLSFMPAGGKMDAREMEGAQSAFQMKEQMFGAQSGLGSNIKQSMMTDLLRSKGKLTATNLMRLQELGRTELLAGNASVLKEMGISPEEAQSLAKNIEETQGSASPDVTSAKNALTEALKSGDKEAITKARTAYGAAIRVQRGIKRTTDEADMALGLSSMGVGNLKAIVDAMPEGDKKKAAQEALADISSKYEGASGAQVGGEFSGQQQKEKDILKDVIPYVNKDLVAKSQKEYEQSRAAMGETDPVKGAEKASAAMDKFSKEMDNTSGALKKFVDNLLGLRIEERVRGSMPANASVKTVNK